MSFPTSRIINDRDIEEYLSALEGGYLSEESLEMSVREDNDESTFYTNRNELLEELEDGDNLENDPNLHEKQDDMHDPHRIQETVTSEAGETSAGSTWVLHKRRLIWKKRSLQFSESNIEFEGSTDLDTCLLDLAVINSWIIYKNNAIKDNVAKNNILNLGEFRNELAFVLCNSGTNDNKRGRPSSSSLEKELQAKKKRPQSKPITPLDIQMYGLGHWLDVGVSLRCKYPHCKGYTTISCA